MAPRDAFVADVLGERVAALVAAGVAGGVADGVAAREPAMAAAAALAARVTMFSCDHVVPRENVFVATLERGAAALLPRASRRAA